VYVRPRLSIVNADRLAEVPGSAGASGDTLSLCVFLGKPWVAAFRHNRTARGDDS